MIVRTKLGPVEYKIVRDNDEGGDRLIIEGKEVGRVKRIKTPFNGLRWSASFSAITYHSVADIVREFKKHREVRG